MNILLIGPPGVGKGTQASIITNAFSLNYVTTGNLLRDEARVDSPLGREIKSVISNGGLVSDDIVQSLVTSSVQNLKNNIVFDGFPRNIQQAKFLTKALASVGQEISLIIHMTLSADVLMKRISGRYVCSGCSAVYNKFFMNTKVDGVCDKCGSTEFIQRSDDNEATLRKRLKIFYDESQDILSYYKEKTRILDIDCSKSVNDISKNIISKVTQILNES